MKIFLGGTCNESTWRDELIPQLEQRGIDYFNPVVDDWNDAAVTKEAVEKDICNVHLYTITPKITGLYSIAEVVESVMKNTHKKVIFNVIADDADLHFNAQQIRSLINIGKMVMTYGAIFVSGLESALLAIETIKEEKTEMTIKKNDFLPKYEKTLENIDSSNAHVNVSDLVTIGNGDLFQLVAKAYSEKEGWMKSTKAMNTPVGCMIQVTTQQKNSDGNYTIAEALSFISGIHVSGGIDNRKFIKI